MRCAVIAFFLFPAITMANKAIEDYIDLSLSLTETLRDQKEFNEEEVHSLAKDCVVHTENFKSLTKTYERYLSNKSEEYQMLFTDKVIIPRHIEYVSHRIEKLPGFYLTKNQIDRFRATLAQCIENNLSREETLITLKQELSKDISEEKANRAIDTLVKDLKMIYKVHGNVVTQVDKELAYLVHDEL